MTSTSPDLLEVVFVCTGNRARSALGEALFRHYTNVLQTTVSSVGTLDVGPAPALVGAVAAGRRLGVDLSRHTARSLRSVDLATADLVLGFESAHVAAAVVDGSADPACTFLLGELAMLLEEMDVQRRNLADIRALIADVDVRRVRYRPDRAAAVVGDPLGKSDRSMRRTAAEIDSLVRRVVLGVFGEINDPPTQRVSAH